MSETWLIWSNERRAVLPPRPVRTVPAPSDVERRATILREAKARFDALTPDQQEAEIQRQHESLARQNMG